MLTNFIVLLITVVAAVLIVKEEKRDFERWLYNDRTNTKIAIMKTMDFWSDYFRKPVRWICVIAILIMQKTVISMFLTAIIFLIVSYYLAKSGCLDKIDWDSQRVQKTVTLISMALVICRFIGILGLLDLVLWIVTAITVIIVLIAVVYLLVTRKK